MRNTTRRPRTGVEAKSTSNRTTSRRESRSRLDDLDISSLLRDDSVGDSNLESIFRRPVTNHFSSSETMAKIASRTIAEEKAQEELSRSDTSRIYTTGYSIHMLTPYIIITAIICIGFFLLDRYFFNIIEFLSEDIRYKIPAYGIFILVVCVLMYLFVKKCLEYISFEMIVTKYKIVQGSKRTTAKNEIPYYSIQEFINDRGIFGRVLNYGNLSIYLTTRRTVNFEKLHGAQYVYDIVERLKYGTIEEALGHKDEVSAMISSSEKIENQSKPQDQEESSPSGMTLDLSDLGFTEAELREMGMSSLSLSTSNSSSSYSNKRSYSNSRSNIKDKNVEQDLIELPDKVVSRNQSRLSSSRRRSRR